MNRRGGTIRNEYIVGGLEEWVVKDQMEQIISRVGSKCRQDSPEDRDSM